MPSRLPSIGGDSNAWGTVLNDFLSQALNANGTLKLLISATDYGLLPTNTAAQNDTAIAAAIAALPSTGGVIAVPALSYNISATIIIDKDNVSLVSFGQRGGAAAFIIDPSVDPTYALIVGNTRNVNSCLIAGIAFQGRNSTTSTGKGILFRTNGGKLLQSKVGLFGGNGITVDSFSGTVFEVFFEDVELVENGMNSTTPGDNLVINGGASDCEYHRVISQGDAAKSTTNNCITVNGAGNQKFVDCHCYFAKHDGFDLVTGNYCQILGGEYENNTANGIESSGTNNVIIGASLFTNGNTDISTYTQATITDCTCASANFANIYASNATGGIISNNTLSGATSAIQLDTGASGYIVHDNICSSTGTSVISTKSTNSDIHDNSILGATGNIVELTGAQGNNIHDNRLSGGSITIVGTTTRVRNNSGYNPVGQVTAPAFPATTVAATNTAGRDVMAYIANGTAAITVIQIAGVAGTYVTTGMQIAASGWGSIRLPVGGSVKFTFASGTPSWTWFGD